MTKIEATVSAAVLLLLSLGTLFFIWQVVISHATEKTRKSKKKKQQRLCGYHLTLEYRSSSLALIDGANCEICHRVDKKEGKT